jgi:hypothetical protein
MLPHESDMSQKLLLKTEKNWTIWFGKPNDLILSIPIAVRSAVGTRRRSFSSDQATSEWKIGKKHDIPRG